MHIKQPSGNDRSFAELRPFQTRDRANPAAVTYFFYCVTKPLSSRLNEEAMDTFWNAWYVLLMWMPWLRAGWRHDRSAHCSRRTRRPKRTKA